MALLRSGDGRIESGESLTGDGERGVELRPLEPDRRALGVVLVIGVRVRRRGVQRGEIALQRGDRRRGRIAAGEQVLRVRQASTNCARRAASWS